MASFIVLMNIEARDADHARAVMAEIMQGVQDGKDAGEPAGEWDASFQEFSLQEIV